VNVLKIDKGGYACQCAGSRECLGCVIFLKIEGKKKNFLKRIANIKF
jgi:hypothetical protein